MCNDGYIIHVLFDTNDVYQLYAIYGYGSSSVICSKLITSIQNDHRGFIHSKNKYNRTKNLIEVTGNLLIFQKNDDCFNTDWLIDSLNNYDTFEMWKITPPSTIPTYSFRLVHVHIVIFDHIWDTWTLGGEFETTYDYDASTHLTYLENRNEIK